ncbi:MAG: GFA family protein [Pseudomonadota bacterium]
MSGRCRCGALSFSAPVSRVYGACHCSSCRRWTSGVWMGVEVKGEVHFNGPLSVENSSPKAERGWCSACGSAMLYRLRPTGHTFLSQGAFDDQTGWQRMRELYGEDQPDHYAFGDHAPLMTGWAVFWAFLLARLPR